MNTNNTEIQRNMNILSNQISGIYDYVQEATSKNDIYSEGKLIPSITIGSDKYQPLFKITTPNSILDQFGLTYTTPGTLDAKFKITQFLDSDMLLNNNVGVYYYNVKTDLIPGIITMSSFINKSAKPPTLFNVDISSTKTINIYNFNDAIKLLFNSNNLNGLTIRGLIKDLIYILGVKYPVITKSDSIQTLNLVFNDANVDLNKLFREQNFDDNMLVIDTDYFPYARDTSANKFTRRGKMNIYNNIINIIMSSTDLSV